MYYILYYLYTINKNKEIMKTLQTMNEKEKRNHLNNILSKIKPEFRYVIEDVTPKGYSPDEQ